MKLSRLVPATTTSFFDLGDSANPQPPAIGDSPSNNPEERRFTSIFSCSIELLLTSALAFIGPLSFPTAPGTNHSPDADLDDTR
ncbi:uncharacterized protein FTOL_13851 [Fusarium torulosum]|uniref:Uncharacterized protein n=1 Tax=Fusarium torulosum TaxID=33205 RepID=A0AAE8MPK9_9HYPO|nr:uncharacterized protein FTOL_13851 [Fusarium torulosum]